MNPPINPEAPGGPGTGDIVAFVEYHLPRAIQWAEQEHLRVRRSRKHYADRAVARGICTVGHVIPELIAGKATLLLAGVDELRSYKPADPSCGYCQTAVEHARMWVPPVGPPPPIDCAVCCEPVGLVLDSDGRWRWSHFPGDAWAYRDCGCGDGSVATPPEWLIVRP